MSGMAMKMLLLLVSLFLQGAAQQISTDHTKKETHPRAPLLRCNKQGECEKNYYGLTLDASWRTLHNVNSYNPCIVAAGLWNHKLCPNNLTCAANCALDGLSVKEYEDLHGISADTKGVVQRYVTPTQYGVNYGSRVYMLEEGGEKYKMFKLKNREFSFDVDVSQVPCGLNAALYFLEMDEDGGRGQGHNDAGAFMGTGYCDAFCTHSSNFIGGKANMDWGQGSCCMEMDLWEGNKVATTMTAHTCKHEGFYACSHEECGDSNHHKQYEGVCDKDGCDFQPFRMGSKDFYGPGKTIDSEAGPITVVTQFITEDGTDTGDLSEIKRFYMVGNFVIPNSESTVKDVHGNGLSDAFCSAQKQAFEGAREPKNPKGVYNQFSHLGGMKKFGGALDRGMVLAFSLWDDEAGKMNWLDASAPKGLADSIPGVKRGNCYSDDGDVHRLRVKHAAATVKYSNIRYGEIGAAQAALTDGGGTYETVDSDEDADHAPAGSGAVDDILGDADEYNDDGTLKNDADVMDLDYDEDDVVERFETGKASIQSTPQGRPYLAANAFTLSGAFLGVATLAAAGWARLRSPRNSHVMRAAQGEGHLLPVEELDSADTDREAAVA